MIIKEFNPVIYPYRIWVVIDKDTKCISEHFYEHNGDEIVFIKNDDTNRHLAFVMSVRNKGEEQFYGAVIYFRSKKSMTMEVIAHEATHAAKYLFEHINAEIHPVEPFEYVVGWIAGCCDKAKKIKNK